jgi:hypothetical protein
MRSLNLKEMIKRDADKRERREEGDEETNQRQEKKRNPPPKKINKINFSILNKFLHI